MGRPKKDIDPKVVRNYAELGATNVEIAHFFGCDEATIRKRFSEELTKGRADRHVTLRQWQWEAARKGNVTMLIWLGKNVLKQTDAVQPPPDDPNAYLETDAAVAGATTPPGTEPPVPQPGPVQDRAGGKAKRQNGTGEA